MALYFVRWHDPRRGMLRRDFHTKRRAEEFRAQLALLSEPPARYPEPRA